MADNLLSTSISALTTEIINSISTANVEELLNLARSAAALGQTENTSIETAINTRVNQLISSATPDEIKKLSDAIKKVRNETQVESQIGNTDNLSEGLTNLYYTDARVDAHLNQTNPTTGYVLSWNGSDYAWIDNTGYTSFDSDFDTRLATKSTTDVTEGTNLYYTDARVQTKLGDVSGHIIPDTNVTYDLGSAEKKFRDLYLSSGTLYLGDTSISVDEVSGGVILPAGSQLDGQNIPTEISQLSDVNLTVQPEVLEIQVDSPDSGGGLEWLWTWVQTQLPFARTNITNELQLSVPIYTQGTYLINNYASSLHGSMTQTHNFFLKWIEGAGTANNISWVTYGSSTESHPDIDGGNSHTVQTLTVNVPQTITLPTLTAPNVSYSVTNNGSGAYTFSGSAHGDNPEIGPFYRGGTYTININATGHPFYFTTDNGTGFVSGGYVGEWTSGVTGSRTDVGTITFTVPSNAPDELYYQCGNHGVMRGNIRVKDLAVETNENGNYIIYGQHDQDGHVQKMEIRPNPELTSQMCIVYDSTTQKFVPQDLATYVENTPSFKNKIKEVAGTATLVAPDGTSLVASVEIYTDASYLPLVGNTNGDIAFAQDTKKLYVWNGTSWEASGLQTNNIDITDINDATNITEKTVSLTHEGVLTPYVGTSRWYAPKDITINKIIARVDVAPTDADLVIQINKTSSGVTTNQQMTISAGTLKTVDLTPNLTLLEDDYLTLDIISVGSTIAGENLRVSFNYK